MRTIKFRAWDSDFGKMIYEFTPDGYSVDMQNGMLEVGSQNGDGDYFTLPLMQFTGLLDKNGKEIYEGDLVESEFGYIGEIIYENSYDRARYLIEWNDGDNCDIFLDASHGEIEVFSNIYENPELINN
jgi:hypothetical protein